MMTNLDKDKKNSDKQYFIPMEVTKETMDAFGINREDVVWKKNREQTCQSNYDTCYKGAVL